MQTLNTYKSYKSFNFGYAGIEGQNVPASFEIDFDKNTETEYIHRDSDEWWNFFKYSIYNRWKACSGLQKLGPDFFFEKSFKVFQIFEYLLVYIIVTIKKEKF